MATCAGSHSGDRIDVAACALRVLSEPSVPTKATLTKELVSRILNTPEELRDLPSEASATS